MTEKDDTTWGTAEYTRAATELREQLAHHFDQPVPADLVVTTRTAIEEREFRAYGQGWRDRGEHEERHRTEAGARGPATDEAKVLPFPHHRLPDQSGARPHPPEDDWTGR